MLGAIGLDTPLKCYVRVGYTYQIEDTRKALVEQVSVSLI